MGGTSLALARRLRTPMFAQRIFVGDGIDIGSGADSLWNQRPHWPKMTSVRDYDKLDGDATTMNGVERESFDFVHSSHCLEHVDEPWGAFKEWWSLVKPGGHLVVIVPDETLYERDHWPPQFNGDHRFRYSAQTGQLRDHTLSFPDFMFFAKPGRLLSLLYLDDGFDPTNDRRDQTADGTCECGIEMVIRKEFS